MAVAGELVGEGSLLNSRRDQRSHRFPAIKSPDAYRIGAPFDHELYPPEALPEWTG